MVTPANNSYAPPKSVVADVPADDEVKAGRGARLGAAIIDGLIFTVPMIPAYLAAIPAFANQAGRRPNLLNIWPTIIAAGGVRFYFGALVAVCLMVLTAVLVHRNGQTIGKKILAIKVARKDGSRAGLARIFWLRYLLNTVFTVIPLVGSLYALVDVLFIFGSAKRCVHDYLADTIVIRA